MAICKATLPGGHIPHSNITVTATTYKGITPWYHSPNTHNMALERLLVIAIRVEDMNLSIIKRNNNILGCQM
jgi:hypothetical protein